MVVKSLLLVAACAVIATRATAAAAPIPDQDWGYVEVEKEHGGNMFWWFYGRGFVPPAWGEGLDETDNTAPQNASDRANFPLVLWLQGGPGASSFIGDVAEFGPRDPYGRARGKYSWGNEANLLFVDNPVGTGLSYVARPGKENAGFVKNQQEVGDQLMAFLQHFFSLPQNAAFLDAHTPFWIFAESYGPKYATTLALRLDQALAKGEFAGLNFKGLALGDGWLDPMGCVDVYADYMYSISLLNEQEREEVRKVALDVNTLVDSGELHKAGNMVDNWVQGPFMSQFWPDIENFVFSPPNAFWAAFANDLSADGAVRKRFGATIPANVSFGYQAGDVGNALAVDFLKPEFHNVDLILAKGYRVVVYEGQFDVVVPVTCTRGWIQKLTWPGLVGFNQAPKLKLKDSNGQYAAFQQVYENFELWNILRAGHMVPMDAPEGAYIMLQSILTS